MFQKLIEPCHGLMVPFRLASYAWSFMLGFDISTKLLKRKLFNGIVYSAPSCASQLISFRKQI